MGCAKYVGPNITLHVILFSTVLCCPANKLMHDLNISLLKMSQWSNPSSKISRGQLGYLVKNSSSPAVNL